MVLALFRVNVENLPFPLREAGTVMQHCAILQGGRSDGGDIEGLLAFGLSNGCTEVSQSPDCGIIHISTEADCSYVPVTLMTDSFM